MPDDFEQELRQLHDDVVRRQYHPKGPRRIAETLSTLMARRGYAQLETAGQRQSVWESAVGPQLAAYSRVGNVRRGVLEVIVSNSAVLQELTFRKTELLNKMTNALPDQKIRDVRLRIGAVN